MNNFEKRQWVRLILCVLVLIAVSLFLTGIIGGEHMTYNLTEKANGPVVNGTAVEETEQGFGGTVTVKATLDGSTVQALTVETPDETPGLGQRASEEDFTSQFIGKEGPFTFGENGIDALSGATVTSNAVLKALNRAITGEDAAETAATETKEETAVEETVPEVKEETAAETAAEPVTEEIQATGTAVEETEQGFGGTVTVKAMLDGSKVTALTVETPDETPGLGQRASEEAFTSQFIGKEGPFTYGENGIDALAGATVTSDAVLKALNRAVGGDTAEPGAEPVKEEKTEPAAETAEAPAETAVTGSKAELPADESRVLYGSYTAKRETPFSYIRVDIDTKGGKITGCRITSEAKSEGSDFLTDEIKTEWAKAIVDNGTAETDAITGATLKMSSEQVVDAVKEILENIR